MPDTLESIDKAWEYLRKIYGDAARVMKVKKNKLVSMGQFPKSGQTYSAHKSQVEWLTNLEITLKEILEVGDQSVAMDRSALNPDTIGLIRKLFPVHIQRKLSKFNNPDGRETILSIITYVAGLIEEGQVMMKDAEVTEGSRKLGAGTSGGGAGTVGAAGQDGLGSGGGIRGSGWNNRAQTQRSIGGNVARIEQMKKSPFLQGLPAVSYYPPQRDEKCRICTQLDAEGDTVDIYEEHYHSVAVGCPRFAAMSMREKINTVKKAKLCNFCLDSEFVVTRPNLPHQNCPVNLKKRPFTCVERNCRMHFWLCDKKDHIKLNSEKFEKAKFWWSRKGKVFANLANIYHYTKPSSKVQVES